MKIVICVHNLANGGAERVASLWASGFSKDGNEVIVILTDKEKRVEFALPENIKIENLWAKGISPVRYIRKVLQLRRLVKRMKPDVVIAVMFPFNVWLPLATIGMSIPCINTEHNSFERPVSSPMTKQIWFQKFYLNRLFSAVTVLTEADKKVIGRQLKKVYVMPNPVTYKPHYVLGEKQKVVLACGRLDVWYVKGFDVLIDAWGKVAKKHPDWQLRIAGRGKSNEASFLMQRAAKLGVGDSVEILGFKSNMLNEYRRASIFAFPSRYDGFGMALLEAMSQGCACVACDYKGRQAEIISNRNEGMLCLPEDISSLADSINILIEDSDTRNRLQQGGCRRSSDFDLKIIIKRWYALFSQIGVS